MIKIDNMLDYTNIQNRFLSNFKQKDFILKLIKMNLIDETKMRNYVIVTDLKDLHYNKNVQFSKAVDMVCESSGLCNKWVREIFNKNKKMKVI